MLALEPQVNQHQHGGQKKKRRSPLDVSSRDSTVLPPKNQQQHQRQRADRGLAEHRQHKRAKAQSIPQPARPRSSLTLFVGIDPQITEKRQQEKYQRQDRLALRD